MKNIKYLTSACKYCRYYQPEGRRGGMCQQLGAPVQASWKACSLALPPFAPSWERLEDVWSLPDATPVLISEINKTLTLAEEVVSCTSEQPKAKVMIH
ncbi:hypothetical protein [Fischerella thermalis]|jgi:hypothetical protein|uniref:Uncharacterized protein n=1 Tax=Fischerella thermalis JSC-11 TaxID=741277 RepID=G6G0E1_9CYAN|nr:hypothetical protein [Fischerella thermalis]PLZ83483.1 hypothetical protein CBP16_03895 [Fischerella thermalis WC217]PMB06841.1 hypothetical protein CEN49_14445 [Fischerella thermalis CCMEE 5273]PMB08074.1 hypothetical protein CI592_08205 [Fischerella thermalis CCMEE 5328]EHC08391.1 hypothetical protein FJSC11DRAFT_4590 [Fischerella thermalis JSC-11]MBF1991515.1 hypothetical protein [Fischerella thermalis M58_A2018_009]